MRLFAQNIKNFFKKREKFTYNYKHPSLNKDKKNFFAHDNIHYVYDHDAIHRSVKVFDRPAYTYFQSENAEVMCDMKKFFTLQESIKLAAVYEESAVLALERSIIPYGTDYEKAFLKALEKVCTSITSGTFREYAWENYSTVRKMFTVKTFDKFFGDASQNLIDMAQKSS